MKHTPSHAVTARAAPAEHFTGEVWIEPQAPGVVRVTFTPGARTAWHTHPQGQTLLILAGRGRVQQRGAAAFDVLAGDVVQIGADEEHWHGAGPDALMTHVAIQAGETSWLKPVTEAEYGP